MAILKLRKEMFPAIYSGKKTSTSRQGKRSFKPGTYLTKKTNQLASMFL